MNELDVLLISNEELMGYLDGTPPPAEELLILSKPGFLHWMVFTWAHGLYVCKLTRVQGWLFTLVLLILIPWRILQLKYKVRFPCKKKTT